MYLADEIRSSWLYEDELIILCMKQCVGSVITFSSSFWKIENQVLHSIEFDVYFLILLAYPVLHNIMKKMFLEIS